MKRAIVFIFMALLASQEGRTQVTEARISLERDSILIGDQIDLILELEAPNKSSVYWPEFVGDTVMTGIEILKRGPIDTIPGENDFIVLRQEILVTSFDSGMYVIEPLSMKLSPPGDTAHYMLPTEPAYLFVDSPDVDMQADIKAIKPPLEAPLTFREIFPWLMLALGIILVAILVIYILRKRRSAEPVFKIRTKPSIPAHQHALNEFERLRQMKLWQSGRVKEYYTSLTDITRWYIEQRFGIKAPEMTTEEIHDSLAGADANEQIVAKLYDTLMLSDLVKFAKEEPLPVENDISLNNCIDFVNETKPRPVEMPEPEKVRS